jgi:hypothetical protein
MTILIMVTLIAFNIWLHVIYPQLDITSHMLSAYSHWSPYGPINNCTWELFSAAALAEF